MSLFKPPLLPEEQYDSLNLFLVYSSVLQQTCIFGIGREGS